MAIHSFCSSSSYCCCCCCRRCACSATAATVAPWSWRVRAAPPVHTVTATALGGRLSLPPEQFSVAAANDCHPLKYSTHRAPVRQVPAWRLATVGSFFHASTSYILAHLLICASPPSLQHHRCAAPSSSHRCATTPHEGDPHATQHASAGGVVSSVPFLHRVFGFCHPPAQTSTTRKRGRALQAHQSSFRVLLY